MLFNSAIFLLFCLLFFAFWPLARRNNTSRWVYITVASFIFYGWWDWRFLFLIVFSGLIDYWAGLQISKRPQYKKLFLILSLIGNLGSLAVFKYSQFFITNINALFSMLGVDSLITLTLPDFFLILPVGISFYTFQSMSYTIDVYRGELKPTANVFHFFAYLSMFPQLVAGPIVRARDMLPQLEGISRVPEEKRWEGLKLIAHGYFKKVVIADNLARMVELGFGAPAMSNSSLFWWVTVTAFAFQIYCDFSGYSDIARGLAKWMGYDIDLNFNHPYISRTLTEFWTRWHISLSTWLRDYLFLPTSYWMSRKLKRERILKLKPEIFAYAVGVTATFVLGGLWHGAAWNFIIWGSLHGVFLSIERITKIHHRLKKKRGGVILSHIIVLCQVWIAWVFFRAESADQAFAIIKRMFSFSGELVLSSDVNGLLFLALIVLREWYAGLELNYRRWLPQGWIKYSEMLIIALVLLACVYLRGEGNVFIYFQF